MSIDDSESVLDIMMRLGGMDVRIALGHGLALKVVAKGVERQEQADFPRCLPASPVKTIVNGTSAMAVMETVESIGIWRGRGECDNRQRIRLNHHSDSAAAVIASTAAASASKPASSVSFLSTCRRVLSFS